MDFLFAKLCHPVQRRRSRLKYFCCSLTCRVFVKVKKSLCGSKFALDSLRVQTLGAETRRSAGGKAKKRRRKCCISLFNWIRTFECVGEGRRRKKPVNKKIWMLKPGRGNRKKVTHLSDCWKSCGSKSDIINQTHYLLNYIEDNVYTFLLYWQGGLHKSYTQNAM